MSQAGFMLEKLKKVEQLAAMSRFGRLLHNPFRYMYAIAFKNFIYPRKKTERQERVKIFSGAYMNILLPSSTDIYLTGGKSHDSEIRLAKFLIHTLKEGNHFLDIGAHYGYFTLLAKELIGVQGKIIALEPATGSVSILKQNCGHFPNIEVIQKAVSDQPGEISFYEFPNLYSEYNGMNAGQFKNEKWFAEFNPAKTIVEAITVNDLTRSPHFVPALIKIDVEGAEAMVIKGGIDFFQQPQSGYRHEILSAERENDQHKDAVQQLRNIQYKTYVIDPEGQLQEVQDIDAYLKQNNMESDNIILQK